MGHANATVVDLVAKTVRTAMGLDRGHVHQQLGIDRITRVVCETPPMPHMSDHIHDLVGALNHAGEQRHAQEHRTPGLREIPVVGGFIQR